MVIVYPTQVLEALEYWLQELGYAGSRVKCSSGSAFELDSMCGSTVHTPEPQLPKLQNPNSCVES